MQLLLSSSSTPTATSGLARANVSSSPLLDRKIEEATAGLLSSFAKQLLSIGEDKVNIETIVRYIAAIKSEVNLSDNYRKDLIALLSRFSKYNDNKPFSDLTHSDVIAFLDTYRKTETQDPMHQWIGTYNLFRVDLMRFFKWLYSPDIAKRIIQIHQELTLCYLVLRHDLDQWLTLYHNILSPPHVVPSYHELHPCCIIHQYYLVLYPKLYQNTS
jgi:hypothetical protein